MEEKMSDLEFMKKMIKDGLFQLFLFTAVPFIVFLILNRRFSGFLTRIGFYMPDHLYAFVVVVVITRSLSYVLRFFEKKIFSDKDIKASEEGGPSLLFRKQGKSKATIIALLFTAIITTGLSEEILFRGFITKGLILWIGFVGGNTIQAIIFSSLHAIPQYITTKKINISVFEFVRVFSIAFTFGILLVYVCNGSILPLWFSHALGNALGFYKTAFKNGENIQVEDPLVS